MLRTLMPKNGPIIEPDGYALRRLKLVLRDKGAAIVRVVPVIVRLHMVRHVKF